MRKITKIQSRIATSKIKNKVKSVMNNNEGVTLTLETVFMLILAILAVAAIWVIVMEYIVGDGSETDTSMSKHIKEYIEYMF